MLGRYESTTMDTAFPGTGMTLWHFRGSHQLFVRIRGGIASLPQRCLVYMRRGLLGGELIGEPNLSLGGAVPRPGHWVSLPAQNGETTYYVGSQYNLNGWKRAGGVHVRREAHTNGFYYTLGFDDIPEQVDYNNHVIEVAVMLRRGLVKDEEIRLVDISPTEEELSEFSADKALRRI